MLLRARILLPLGRPPLENAYLEVRGERIARIFQGRSEAAATSGRVIDLGDTVVLPGLVNAHCHLDYTAMAGRIKPPRSFTAWIQSMVGLKSSWSYSDFAASWLEGAGMLLRNGVTTVANIETAPEILAEVNHSTPLRQITFLEIIQLKDSPSPGSVVAAAAKTLKSFAQSRGGVGLSPHAPYSTTPEILRSSAKQCRKDNWPLSIHVGESAEEFEMYMHGTGRMFRWLKSQRRMDDCGCGSPVSALEKAGVLGPNLLAVHANYLDAADPDLLRRHQVTVVHCPRSHAYFGHDPFPYDRLRAEQVAVCLGTDSLATIRAEPNEVPELNLFLEMQKFWQDHPEVAPETILGLGTRSGARSLGLAGRVGELTPGGYADLIAVPYSGPVEQACEAVVNHPGAVSASMIGGKWAMRPNVP